MKQKVVTRVIIEQNKKILLLRRHGGRPSIDGKYELPGGRVHINQQPEDALHHAMSIHLGVDAKNVQLRDVMTFVDPDDRELQYVFLIFSASLEQPSHALSLSDEYDSYTWKPLTKIQQNDVTQSTQQILGLQPVPFAPGRTGEITAKNDHKKTTLTLHLVGCSDGGSRGNPGPAAAGYVLLNTTKEVVAEGGSYLGIATNNVAEYQALYLALQKALELGATSLDMRLDSQVVVRQMNGEYNITHDELRSIHNRVKELMTKFEKVTFSHVPREQNTLADGVVNNLLDEATAQRRGILDD